MAVIPVFRVVGHHSLTARWRTLFAITPSFIVMAGSLVAVLKTASPSFGIFGPGWFMKTEYRAAYFERITLRRAPPTGIPPNSAVTFKPLVQTISTSLVYRFNWGGARTEY